MKALILSLQHRADKVESAPNNEARAMVADLLVRATHYYERFRSGCRWESSQFVFCYLHLLTVIAMTARRLGGETGSPLGLKDIVGFSYEDICWFEMPDTPKKGDKDGCKQFVVSGINEMDRWIRTVCAARPEPFLASLHQLVRCATACVSQAIVRDPESERRMFSALARLIRRIYLRIDSDADLERWVADIAIDMEVCFRDRPGYFNAAATNNFARYQYFVMHHVRSRNGLLDCQIRDFIPAYSNSIQRLNAMRYVANTATNRDQAVWATNQVNRLSALLTNQLNNVSWLEE